MKNNNIKIGETALLVIDVLNSCCHENCEVEKWKMTFKKIRRMVPKLKKFIKDYKKLGGKVIYVNYPVWIEENLKKNIVELYKNPACRYYSKDKTGFSNNFFQLKPEKDDIIITKNSYDAFSNKKMDKNLKKLGVKYLIITGVFGDGCVHATIQGGFSSGYNFIIVKNLIETTDNPTRQELQALMKKWLWPKMFGRTVTAKKTLEILKK
ncbi:MAG: isochorismatase family protein [Candidatus Magasanikbacteria bacterium]|nr:isochorismatase family protein [Candidatus Magasanikbacteria bacterium]